jgi:predicted metalloprotease
MRLPGQESDNIEDRRGSRGGGGGRLAVGGGLGTVAIIVISLLLGVDPRVVLQQLDQGGGYSEQASRQAPPPQGQPQGQQRPMDDDARRFVAQVLATTEESWEGLFREAGRNYQPPRLVLFSRATQTGCGNAPSSVGPFYCPEDQRVYIDLDFLSSMQRELNAPGDFARAYVIAHEVGHHVQQQLGIIQRVNQARQRMNERDANALSVRLELQADCFAGVWANRTQARHQILENGDVEAGMNAAASVGDDRLQRRSQGQVVPESFTHGTSAQRVRWFKHGMEVGRIDACDTFNTGR